MATPAAPDPLLRSKLTPPSTRPALVDRPGPQQLLDLGMAGKLTLVDAPAGWGKTTLVATWLRSQSERRPAWLALDAADDDQTRFWTYLIEAIRAGRPGFGDGALQLLRSPGTPPMAAALPALLNELEAAPGDGVIIVLDDYHVITDPKVHAGMTFLIDHLSARDHVVVVTRTDPPFPLARWRVRRQVTEVRVDDLRFDADDTGRLLNGALGLDLQAQSIARLQGRTEGWVAGLLLAAISLRAQPDPEDFVTGFAGDDRHIVDYLGSEVLDSLSQPIRAFLVRTSILDRLSGPLCDAVTQTSGSAEMLAQVERANLFLAPIDSRGEWFRYHQLFAELLRVELERTERHGLPDLHRRAATWFLDNGFVAEAIRHATIGGDSQRAADLLAERWSDLLQRGDLAAITQALDALGDSVVRADPRLCLIRAWMTINLGRVTELGDWLDTAEIALKEWSGTDTADFTAAAGMLRCIEEYLTGNAGAAIAAARQALDLDAVELPPWRSVGCPVLGIALYWSGRPDEATSTLRPAMRRALDAGNHLAQLHGTGCLALAAAERGEAAPAGELIERATAIRQSSRGFQDHWAGAMALLALGRLKADAGDLDAAERSVTEAVELSRRGLARIELAYGLLELAALQLRRGQRQAAGGLVAEAEEALARCGDPGVVAGAAVELARLVGARPAGGPRKLLFGEELSHREQAVLALLPTDLTLRDIAGSLFVSANTVKTHTRAIYRKLGATNRSEAVARARQLGLA